MADSEQRTAKIINVTKNGYHLPAELRREWVGRPRVDSICHIPEEFCSPLSRNLPFSLDRDELQLEFLRLFGQPFHLLLAIPSFIVLHPFVHVLFAIPQHAVDQPRQLVRHGRDCFGRSEPSSQPPKVRSQRTLAIAQRRGS